MTSKLCKTCGRDKLVHTEWDFDKAICEKFQPEDVCHVEGCLGAPHHIIINQKKGSSEEKVWKDYLNNVKKKQKKGCGKIWQRENDVGKTMCGYRKVLCPSCSNQSHRLKLDKSPVDTTNRNEAGTQSPTEIGSQPNLGESPKEEDTSTLSDKIGKTRGSKKTQFKKGYIPWNYEGKERLKRKYKRFNGKLFLNAHVVWLKYNNLTEIPKSYVVHHKDGDSLNDSIQNLILMKDSEHKSLHNKKSKVIAGSKLLEGGKKDEKI